MLCHDKLRIACCAWLVVLLLAFWGNGVVTAQPAPLPASKDLTVRLSDCTSKCTTKETWCSSQDNPLCTVGCKCVGDLWETEANNPCTDDTEAHILCDNVGFDKDGWGASYQTKFKIYSVEEPLDGGTGYRGVVTAVHTRPRSQYIRGVDVTETATLRWSTCYERKSVDSDVCGCKCGFALRARPARMANCRCIKGV